MSGIYGLYSKKQLNIKKNIFRFFYSSNFENVLNEEYQYENFIFGRSVIPKFLNDRIIHEDEEFIIGFEGIIFNKETKNSFDSIKAWYQQKNIKFVEDIQGQFCGFIYDKKINKLFIYNDHLSTKPLYFYHDNEIFIFASELKVVTKLLYELKITKELDYDAIYCMLTFGYMLGNTTYEKNTKKLQYATILEIDKFFNSREIKYFEYTKNENFNLSKQEIIDTIDTLLSNSVKNYWSKDEEYGYSHYAFLSGGLDSRVNLFLAKEQGYQDVLTMTFSQSKSSDDIISQNISTKEYFKHIFYSLDNGRYLEQNLEKYVNANDGLVNLQGSAGGFSFLSVINHKNYGLLHTGQIGDVLFGSFVKKNFKVQQGIMSDQKDLLKDISFLDRIMAKYDNNPEIFSFEQRQQNSTLNGDRTYANYVDVASPFYNRDLIEFCLTIPNKYKKNEAIYIDWFNAKHKNIANFIWESAGVKPRNINIIKIAKKIKRYKNAILRRLGFNINDMNPFDIWLRNNDKILTNLNNIFSHHIDNVEDKKLKNIIISMYNADIQYGHYGRNNKFLVVTLLLALVLHFGDDN